MSGGGSKSQTQASSVEIPKEFKPYVFGGGKKPGVLPEATDLYEAGQLGQVAKQSAATRQGLQSTADAAGMIQDTLIPQATGAYTSMLNPTKLSGSSQLSGAMQAATSDLYRGYERSTIPAIEDAAAATGNVGSSRQGIAEGLARSDLERSVANINASMQYQAAQDDATRALQSQTVASQYLPTLMNTVTMPGSLQSQVGAVQDQYRQNQLDANMTNLSNYASLLRQFIPGTNQTTVSSGGGPSKAGSVLGGAASGAATGAMLGSVVPVLGTGVGAVAGGVMGGLGGLL